MLFFARFKILFLLGAMFAAPLVLIYAQKRNPELSPKMSGVASDLRSPIQSMLISLCGSLGDFFYLNRILRSDETENLHLRARVEQNLLLKQLLADAEIENRRLREMLESASKHDDSLPVVGRVIGRMGSPLTRSIQIDVGEKDGVARGDAVIDAKGAVGQIVVVGKHASEVILVSDASSAIDVVVERSRVRGLLKGALNPRKYRLQVKDFDRLGEVQKGDIVVTSGIGAKFPRGIPVGRVIKAEGSKDRLYIEAEIKPFVSMGTLEEVMVLATGTKLTPWTREELSRVLIGQNLVVSASMRK